jgi:ferredoxin
MKVTVDRDLCQGHAECTVEAPEVFALPDGAAQVVVLTPSPDPSRHDAVRTAVRYCPTHALRIEED